MRDHKLDNIKFLMLFLVVFGHILEMGNIQSGIFNVVYTGIYMFHMPIMVIISGYFSRTIIDRGEQGILKRYIKLVVPSLILQFIFAVVSYMFTGTIQPYWVLWYTLALVIWDYLIDYTKFRYWPIFMLLMVFIFGNMGMIINTLFGRIVYFMPFYLIGYYLDLSKLDSLSINSKRWVLLSSSVLAVTGVIIFMNSGLDYLLFYFSKGYSELGLDVRSGVFYRSVAYVIAISLSTLFLLLMSKRAFKYVQSANIMTTYLLHGLIIKTVGWLFDVELTSMLVALIFAVLIVALTAPKKLFSDMFKDALDFGVLHKNIIHSFRATNLLIIFAIYGYLVSPLILEAKSQKIQNDFITQTQSSSFGLQPYASINSGNDSTDVSAISFKNFVDFNWDKSPSSESTNALTDIGSVIYDNVKRKPRVEYAGVYNLSLNGRYLSYDDQKFMVVDERMNMKINFIELDKQIGIELLNENFLSAIEGKPTISKEPIPLDYEIKDRKVAFKYQNKYLSLDSDELVFVSQPIFWDVELEVIDDSPLTYFSQIDERWRYDDFAFSTVSTRGCGLVSMAMILNYLVDSSIDVNDMISLDRQYALGRSEPPRIYIDKFAEIIENTYDVKVKKISLKEIPSEIKSGRLVYYHTSSNSSIGYKNFGHIVVIYGISQNGMLKYLDPYPGNISQIPADVSLQYFDKTFSYEASSGIRTSSAFSGYISLNAMEKSSSFTAYSIWR